MRCRLSRSSLDTGSRVIAGRGDLWSVSGAQSSGQADDCSAYKQNRPQAEPAAVSESHGNAASPTGRRASWRAPAEGQPPKAAVRPVSENQAAPATRLFSKRLRSWVSR